MREELSARAQWATTSFLWALSAPPRLSSKTYRSLASMASPAMAISSLCPLSLKWVCLNSASALSLRTTSGVTLSINSFWAIRVRAK